MTRGWCHCVILTVWIKVKICFVNVLSKTRGEWFRRRASSLRITSRMGSVMDKPLSKNFTFITQYWLVTGAESRVSTYYQIKINLVYSKHSLLWYHYIWNFKLLNAYLDGYINDVTFYVFLVFEHLNENLVPAKIRIFSLKFLKYLQVSKKKLLFNIWQ